MDELAESLAVSFSVSSDPNSISAPHPRFSEYKRKGSKSDQESRRKHILQQQKEQRFDYANLARRLVEDDWTDADELAEDGEDEMECVEPTKRTYRPGRYYRNQLMLSEWLIEVPEDFEENWLMVMCPWGKRCLIVSARGKTTAYGRNGYRMNSFPSHLPGGNRHQAGRYKENAILDCIFHEVEKTFYVLDIMNWKDHPVYDSETEFRVFWMQSKMQECPELGEIGSRNPYKFVPLPYHPCHRDNLRAVFEVHEDQFDGCLFYHKQAHYVFGPSPLVVWLKPYMVQEMIGIETPERMMTQKPVNYSTYASHLEEVNERKKKIEKEKENRKKTRRLRGPDRAKDFKMDLMASRWLTSLPEDLISDWSVLACPVGQRCLVMAIDGETKWYNKKGFKLPGYFLSALPGGNGMEYGSGPTVVTLLDCIFDEEAERFFVLDCIRWADHDLQQFTYTERMSFLTTEIQRRPDIKYITELNSYPMIPLYTYGTTEEDLDALIRTSKFEIDGLLFYKKEAPYVSGETDNVLWTKLYMLPDLFHNIAIPKPYMQQKPQQYKDFNTFVEDLKNGKWTEGKRKKGSKKPFIPKVELHLPPQKEVKQGKGKKNKQNQNVQNHYYGQDDSYGGHGFSGHGGWGQVYESGDWRGYQQGEWGHYNERGHTGGFRGRGGSYGPFRGRDVRMTDKYGMLFSRADAGGDGYQKMYGLGRGRQGMYGQDIMSGHQYYPDERDMFYSTKGYGQSAGRGRGHSSGVINDPFSMGDLQSSLPTYDYDPGRQRPYSQSRKPFKMF